MKKKTITILIASIILIGSTLVYYYIREEHFSNYITNVDNCIKDENYNQALLNLQKAKEIKNSNIIKEKEDTINLDIEQTKILNEGLNLSQKGKYKEAIETLNKIDPNAYKIRDKANKEISILKDKLISNYANLANTYIEKNDFEKADTEIQNISSIDNTNKSIKNLKDLENNKIKKQKYYNCKYRGISDTQKEGVQHFAAVPSKPCITRYYNPDLMTEKTFIKFYRDNIESKLYDNYCYVLRSTKDNNYGILFVTIPNENDEFNMGKIASDGF